MKEEISRSPLSTPGRYYVDADACVHHHCCVDTAPNNFKMDDLIAYVCKQPSTPEEEALCREALEACPTAAIHDDVH